ncbi:MAG: AmmeMemoRadiSam system protein B [Candidatus Eisenbacteria bacterium]|nr:AmmeMemoRadiSam system protein B [Candidatus Eisenbacteria bacterium]
MRRTHPSIREARWDGQFYPADPRDLEREILRFLDEAEGSNPGGEVIGLVSPHAGYVYSGPVAGSAYAAVRGRSFARVVVLSPSHRAAFHGASIWPAGAYRTPLGDVPIDEKGAAGLLLAAKDLVRDLPGPHIEEHALEVQIPFLQVSLGAFRLIPLVLGSHDLSFAEELAGRLADLFGSDDTLYLASSDLSHFHSYDDAVRIDRLLLDLLERLEIEKLAGAIEAGNTEACGIGPILALGAAARDRFGARARLLRYANSGDTAGGKSEVVGYASLAFVREGRE